MKTKAEPIREASEVVKRHLSNYDWAQMLGLGVGEIFVYTSKAIPASKQPITEVNGYPVKYVHLGKVRPQ
jgi:hypothetical protein